MHSLDSILCPMCETGELINLKFKKKVKYNCTELEIECEGGQCDWCREISYSPEQIKRNEEALRDAKLDYDLECEDNAD